MTTQKEKPINKYFMIGVAFAMSFAAAFFLKGRIGKMAYERGFKKNFKYNLQIDFPGILVKKQVDATPEQIRSAYKEVMDKLEPKVLGFLKDFTVDPAIDTKGMAKDDVQALYGSGIVDVLRNMAKKIRGQMATQSKAVNTSIWTGCPEASALEMIWWPGINDAMITAEVKRVLGIKLDHFYLLLEELPTVLINEEV